MPNLLRLALPSLLLVAPVAAVAAPCPNVMLVLDRSGSMDGDVSGVAGGFPTKWSLLQKGVSDALKKYGDQLPFGVEMFTSAAFGDPECFADTQIDVEPGHGTATQITSLVQNSAPEAGSNIGEAVKRAAVDPALQDPARGQYLVLITDGDPNCNSGDTMGAYTIGQLTAAAAQNTPLRTFVIAFDGIANRTVLNQMAQAGGAPQLGCNGSTRPCYYPATDATSLAAALDTILGELTSPLGMTCDDSCFANGCQPGFVCLTNPNTGAPSCVPDPCAGAQCGPNLYCRGGQCVAACVAPCGAGTRCINGTCLPDPCATASCAPGEVCDPQNGRCVVDACVGRSCAPPTICEPTTGRCVDDWCRLIVCPAATVCKPGGHCEALGSPPPPDGGVARADAFIGGGFHGGKSGCSVGLARRPGIGALLVAGALAGLLLRRRRARPRT